MLFDSEEQFPNSVVRFVKFHTFELRQMFAYLRHREALLQQEIEKAATDKEALVLKLRLEVVETNLIWMANNVTGSAHERALRKWGC